MNTYYVDDSNIVNSESYKQFLKNNPGLGYLNIRAFTANQAVPISGLNISVYTIIDNDKIIFFEGSTDSSGVINGIALPAPKPDLDNLDIPNKTTYEIETTYNNITKIYKINIYENLSVIQNINIIPEGGI